MSKRFLEGGEQYTVFVGRADRDPQAIAQSRMQIPHQHALPLQRFVSPLRPWNAHQEKVRLRRKYRYPGEAGEGAPSVARSALIRAACSSSTSSRSSMKSAAAWVRTLTL